MFKGNVNQLVSLQESTNRPSPKAPTGWNPAAYNLARKTDSRTATRTLFQLVGYPPQPATPAGVQASPWPFDRRRTPSSDNEMHQQKRQSLFPRLNRPELRVDLTVIASKKRISPLAVCRTQTRRRVRQAVTRLIQNGKLQPMPRWSYMVFPNKLLLRANEAELEQQMLSAFRTINEKSFVLPRQHSKTTKPRSR